MATDLSVFYDCYGFLVTERQPKKLINMCGVCFSVVVVLAMLTFNNPTQGFKPHGFRQPSNIMGTWCTDSYLAEQLLVASCVAKLGEAMGKGCPGC